MPRLLFKKTGDAVWISHLDLMRLFQRAFQRAGLPLTHTQGFNPRPAVSIALPLSVGVESHCELLDFDLCGAPVSCDGIKEKLNKALITGVQVLDVYEQTAKIKDIAYLDCAVDLEYDAGVPSEAPDSIMSLFARHELPVEKRGKNGAVQQDIIPMIKSLQLQRADGHTLTMNARICCQNPALNPMQLANAVCVYLPEFAPSFCKCRRIEIYDGNETVFR